MPSQATEEALLTLAEMSRFLHMSQKTVLKLAREKKIPAIQIEKEWRFRRDDIDIWLESQLHGDKVEGLANVTDGMAVPLGDLLPDAALVHDMRARNAIGAIEELAARAYGNNWLNDKPWFVGALVEREELSSTAMEGGVAFLHTRARDTKRISRPFVIVGRSYSGVDFGAPDGQPTYLFFLLGLKYDKLHLPILGRLARIMLRDPRTIARLRSTTSPSKMRGILLRLDTEEMQHKLPPPMATATAPATKAAPILDKDLRLRTIMRAQAQRKHELKKQAEIDRKAEIKREKDEAAAAKRAETAERRRIAADQRKAEATKKKEAAAKKKAAEKAAREREAAKKKASAEKKKAAANLKREKAAEKKRVAAEKKKAAADKKKEAAAKKKAAASLKREKAATKNKAVAAKKKAAAEKKKAAAAKKKAAAAKKKAAAAKKKASADKKKVAAKKKAAAKGKAKPKKKSAAKKQSQFEKDDEQEEVVGRQRQEQE